MKLSDVRGKTITGWKRELTSIGYVLKELHFSDGTKLELLGSSSARVKPIKQTAMRPRDTGIEDRRELRQRNDARSSWTPATTAPPAGGAPCMA